MGAMAKDKEQMQATVTPPTHEVVRFFDVDGVRLRPGTRVNARGWRLLDKLVSQRYLRPLPTAQG